MKYQHQDIEFLLGPKLAEIPTSRSYKVGQQAPPFRFPKFGSGLSNLSLGPRNLELWVSARQVWILDLSTPTLCPSMSSGLYQTRLAQILVFLPPSR